MEEQEKARIGRIGFYLCFPIVAVVPAFIILEFTPLVVVWVMAWSIPFGVVPLKRPSIEVKGFIFIGWSVLLSTLGIAYATKVAVEWVTAIKLVSEIMVLACSGVGGNLIAHGLVPRMQAEPVTASSSPTKIRS